MAGLTSGMGIGGKVKKAKKSKAKGRKISRNKLYCQSYRLGNRYEINKCRKLRKVLKRNPNDVNALASLIFNSKVLSARQCETLGLTPYLQLDKSPTRFQTPPEEL